METQTFTPSINRTPDKNTGTSFTFQKITDVTELERAFRLRHELQSQSRINTLPEYPENKVDVSVFDLHSTHYGIYTDKKELIGYLRVFVDNHEHYDSKVYKIYRKFNLASGCDFAPEGPGFNGNPGISDLSSSDSPEDLFFREYNLADEYEGFNGSNRLLIREEYRGVGMAAFLIECAKKCRSSRQGSNLFTSRVN